MPKKLHPMAKLLELAKALTVDNLEVTIALLQTELKGKRPVPVKAARKSKISHTPPVNEATRIGG